MLKILKYLLIAGSSWFITHSLYIVYDGLKETGQQADMTGVFGNKVNEDGTLSPRLKARLDKCIELYRKKQAKNILVSGGLGKEGYWEGTEMKKYLIKTKSHPIISLWITLETIQKRPLSIL